MEKEKNKLNITTLHQWLRKQRKEPKFCEFCKKNPPKHLAKISEYYTKNPKDYKYLCVRCHSRWDKKYPSKQKVPSAHNGRSQLIPIYKNSKMLGKINSQEVKNENI